MTTTTIETTQTIQLAIRATPEQVWHALTDGSVTPAYYVGFEAHFDLTPGADYRYTAGGGDMITGTVLEVEPALAADDDVQRPLGPGGRRAPRVHRDLPRRRAVHAHGGRHPPDLPARGAAGDRHGAAPHGGLGHDPVGPQDPAGDRLSPGGTDPRPVGGTGRGLGRPRSHRSRRSASDCSHHGVPRSPRATLARWTRSRASRSARGSSARRAAPTARRALISSWRSTAETSGGRSGSVARHRRPPMIT